MAFLIKCSHLGGDLWWAIRVFPLKMQADKILSPKLHLSCGDRKGVLPEYSNVVNTPGETCPVPLTQASCMEMDT